MYVFTIFTHHNVNVSTRSLNNVSLNKGFNKHTDTQTQINIDVVLFVVIVSAALLFIELN